MSTLTVTAKGQVTLPKELLQHLGIKPGDKVEIKPLPGGRLSVQASNPTGTIEDFFGCLAGKSDRPAPTIEEINEIIADAWAGKR